MFSIADHELLATLIIEVDDLESAIEDINAVIEFSLAQKMHTKEDEEYFISLVHQKQSLIGAKIAYTNKLNELENKAYRDNYNPYIG